MKRDKQKAWMALLKKDHDYDWSFFVQLVIRKLRNMQERFDTVALTTSSKRNARDIGRCIKLLERVAAEDYPFEPEEWKKSDKAQQKDLDKALAIISKRLFTWWD